jgi:hypothetical protein
MNASHTLHHSLIRVLLVLCLLVPAVARSTALYDITGSLTETLFNNVITATGQIHFVGDLSTDGTFPLSTTGPISATGFADFFTLTFTCTEVGTPGTCFSPITFGLADLTFGGPTIFAHEYTVTGALLTEIDLEVDPPSPGPFTGFLMGASQNSGTSDFFRVFIDFPGPTLSCELGFAECLGTYELNPSSTPTPEPGTLALFALGLSGLAYRRAKQRPS